MMQMHYFYKISKSGLVSRTRVAAGLSRGKRVGSIHRAAEKAHSRKLVVASSATNIPFYTGQSSHPP
jgi:hypothetical protein